MSEFNDPPFTGDDVRDNILQGADILATQTYDVTPVGHELYAEAVRANNAIPELSKMGIARIPVAIHDFRAGMRRIVIIAYGPTTEYTTVDRLYNVGRIYRPSEALSEPKIIAIYREAAMREEAKKIVLERKERNSNRTTRRKSGKR